MKTTLIVTGLVVTINVVLSLQSFSTETKKAMSEKRKEYFCPYRISYRKGKSVVISSVLLVEEELISGLFIGRAL